MADGLNVDWRRAITRGAAIGVVIASHLALLAWVVAPPRPQSRRPLRQPVSGAPPTLRVELLTPAPGRAPHRPPARSGRNAAPRRVLPALATATRGPRPAQSTPSNAAPVAAGTVPAVAGFIAGGGFDARLRASQTPAPIPKLPGGHRYLAADLQFVPVEQQSIEGKVNRVAGLLFGGFDPVCKNTEYELAKTREQMYADGYTMRELEQRLR